MMRIPEQNNTVQHRVCSGETALCSTTSASRLSFVIGGQFAGTICVFFALLWWNRFFAVTNDGWHFFFAHQIANGKIPYRDFYLFVPPLLQLEMATTIKLFGDHLLVSQIVGLFEIAILAFALYNWLARLFAPAYAFFGAVSSILLCMANRTEALNALHLPGMFYAVLAGTIATLSVDSEKTRVSFAFAGGMLAGLAFLAKQTSGIAAPFGLLFVLGIVTGWLHGLLKAAKILLTFSLGCSLPLIAVGGWLASQGALRDAISDLFLKGISSKGSPLQMLLRIFWMTWGDGYLVRYFFLAAFIVAGFLIFFREHLGAVSNGHVGNKNQLYVVAVLFAAAILLGWAFSFHPTMRLPSLLVHLPDFSSAFLGWVGSLSLFVTYLWWLLTGRLRRDQGQHLMLAGFSFAMAFMNSLSWPTDAIVIVPAFGFVVANMLAALRDARGGKSLQLMIEIACLVCIAQITFQKCASPYEWGGWREPSIHSATVTVNYPKLQGYRLSPQTAQFLTRVTDEIDSHSSEHDPIFVYPDLPIFYLISHRQPETFGYVHYIDVAPDFVDVADANTLRLHPPAVIVYLKPSEEDLRLGETNFRGGNRSGQRDLVEAIAAIRPQYEMLDSFVTPGSNKTVEILVSAKH